MVFGNCLTEGEIGLRMKKISSIVVNRFFLLCTVFLIVAADQGIKNIVESSEVGSVIFRLSPLFEVIHTKNHGTAFSMFSGKQTLILIVTTAMLLLLATVMLVYSRLTNAARWSIALMLAGGVGNWIDRISVGGVTDYICTLFIRFPVFNLADICITLSSVVLFFLVVLGKFEFNPEETHGRTN